MSYNYSNFSPNEYDLSKFQGPGPGEKAPDAFFVSATGGSRRLLDFDTDFLVIEVGSVTCNLFQDRRDGMGRLCTNHPRAKFVILYTREVHPGANISQHKTIEDKFSNAQILDDGRSDRREVLVDNIEGSAHEAYGSYPNSVFIVNRNRCVVFASDWNDPNATGHALRLLEAGQPANVRSFFKPSRISIDIETFKRNGKGSAEDFFGHFPALLWKFMIVRNWRVLTGKHVPIKPDSYC